MNTKTLIRRSALLLSALALLLGAGCGSGSRAAELRFHSFDGGGPSYHAVLDDPSLLSVQSERKYGKKNHAVIDGAAYDVIFRFRGLKSGETRLRIEERSPIAGNADHLYAVSVAQDLSVSLTLLSVEDLDAAVTSSATLVIATERGSLLASFADNPTAAAFRDELSRAELGLMLLENGGFEKRAALPFALEPRGESAAAQPGELVLCGGDTLCLLYAEGARDGTPLARIDNADAETLRALLGDGDLAVTLWAEWSE